MNVPYRLKRQTRVALSLGVFLTGCTDGQQNVRPEVVSVAQPIIGGETAANGAPGITSILWSLPDGIYPNCGATHIAPGYLLTAAHCFSDDAFSLKDFSQFKAIIMPANQFNWYPYRTSVVGIRRITMHPEFRRPGANTRHGDVALVRLEQNSDGPVATLATADDVDAMQVGDTVKVFGWGMDDLGNTQSVLNTVDQKYYGEGQTCRDQVPELSNITDKQMCLGRVGDQVQGVCFVDSGGPAYVEKDSQLVQVGIVSGGGGTFATCGDAIPDMFTSVARVRDFIDRSMNGVRGDFDGDGNEDGTAFIWEGPISLLVDVEFDGGEYLTGIDTGIPYGPIRQAGSSFLDLLEVGQFVGDSKADIRVRWDGLESVLEGGTTISPSNPTGKLHGLPTANKDDGRFLLVGGRGFQTIDRPKLSIYLSARHYESTLKVSVFDADMQGKYDFGGGGAARTCMRLYPDSQSNGPEDDPGVIPLASWDEVTTPLDDATWFDLYNGPQSDQAFDETNYNYRLEIYLAETCDSDPQSTPADALNSFKIASSAQLKIGDRELSFIAHDSAGPFAPSRLSIPSDDTQYGGFFNFGFYKTAATQHIILKNADADDLDHPSPGLADGANHDIDFKVYAGANEIAHGYWPEVSGQARNGRPSGNYTLAAGVENGSEEVLELYNVTGLLSVSWLWRNVLGINNVHLWIARGSPSHLDLVAGSSFWNPSTGIRPAAYWRWPGRVAPLLPILLGTPAGQYRMLTTEGDALRLLAGTESTVVADRFAANLLLAKLNLGLASNAAEPLATARVYGTTDRIADVLAEADRTYAAGASATPATLDRLTNLLRALGRSEVTYASLPVIVDGAFDDDHDGIPANLDNCPTVANVDQVDTDRNGIGNACEPKPFLSCVAPAAPNTWTAVFGYDNPMQERRIAIGPRNRFTTGAPNRGQPVIQAPGRHERAFTVTYSGSSLTWQLADSSATASTTSPRCSGIQLTRIDGLPGIALYADGTLTIGDRVSITDNGPVASAGVNTNIDVGARAKVGYVRSAGTVSVRSAARVGGGVSAAGNVSVQAGAAILGRVETNKPQNLAHLAWSPSFPPSTGDIRLEPGQSRSVAPGSFNLVSIKSRATLMLSTGSYFFQTFELEPSAVVQLDQARGPVIIHVRSTFTMRGSFVTLDGRQPDLLIGYFGTGAAWLEAPMNGAVIAPQGSLIMGGMGSGQYRGTFFARTLELRPDLKITYTALPSLAAE